MTRSDKIVLGYLIFSFIVMGIAIYLDQPWS